MDFDVVLQVLSFDGEQQRPEPFEGAKVTANPEEVNLSESCLALWVVHAVPDALEDRCERRDTNTGTAKHSDFELEYVLRGTAKRSINVHAREDSLQSWVRVCLGCLLHDRFVCPTLPIKFSTKCFGKRPGKVAHATDMDRDVVFFRCACEGKGVVLPDRDFGTAQEDVLACTSLAVLLLDLDFDHVAGVLDDL